MQPQNKLLLKKDYQLKSTGVIVDIPLQLWQLMEEASNLLFEVGKIAWERYRNGDTTVKHYLEYGLPIPIRTLLRTTEREIDKHLLRFDYFISVDGPKLIECARNPWHLFFYQRYSEEMEKEGVERFPADEIYRDLFCASPHRSIGFWEGFGIFLEEQYLISLAEKLSIFIHKINPENVQLLDVVDGLLVDLDTAWFQDELSALLAYQHLFIPSPTHIIYKHKSFLALVYALVSGELDFGLSILQLAVLNQCIVKTYLVEQVADVLIEDVTSGGAVKEIVGMWSRQVTLLSPELAKERSNYAKNARRRFKRHLKASLIAKNAIVQQYIEPISLPTPPKRFAEISLVASPNGFVPFVKIYTEEKGLNAPGAGLGFLRVSS